MFNQEELIKVINGEPIGSYFPYLGGTKKQIVDYLRSVVSDIDSSKVIKVEADFTSYGSGYASYVDVFCYKRDGSSMKVTKHGQDISGVSLYLCKLAPVAVWGENEKNKHSKGGGYGFLSAETVESLPEGDWNEFIFILKTNSINMVLKFLRNVMLGRF